METNWEQYIKMHGRHVPIVGFGPGVRRYGLAMPEDLTTLIRWINEVSDDFISLDEVESETLEALWESMKVAFVELDPDALEDEWQHWSGHQLCEAIIQVVANGMRYVWLPLTHALGNGNGPTAAYGRSLYRVQTFEMFMISFIKAAMLDSRCPAWLAAHPMDSGLSGLCRHYALIARVLFVAAQHSTGLWQEWDLVDMRGRASLSSGWGHAWNWLVDHQEGVIYSFDITRADWQVDRKGATSVFNDSLDGSTMHLNRSAFVANVLWAYGMTGGNVSRDITLRRALPTMIDLDEPDDIRTLYCLTKQGMVRDEVVDLIFEKIEGWLNADETDRSRGPAPASWLASPELQVELLEIMFSEPEPSSPWWNDLLN